MPSQQDEYVKKASSSLGADPPGRKAPERGSGLYNDPGNPDPDPQKGPFYGSRSPIFGYTEKFGNSEQYYSSNANIGIDQTRPVVAYMADFVPIYQNSTLNKVGSAISYKDSANLISAKNAISFLLNNDSLKKELADREKKIKEVVNSQITLVNNYLSAIHNFKISLYLKNSNVSIQNVIYPQTSIIDFKEYNVNFKEYNVADILSEREYGGYSRKTIQGSYSNTKIWQLLMYALHDSCESYLEDFPEINAVASRVTESTADDLKLHYKKFLDNRKLWLNSNISTFLSNMSEKNYYNDANNIRDAFFKEIHSSNVVPLSIFDNVTPEIQIAFLSIILSKEARYSKTLNDKNNLSVMVNDTTDYAEVALIKPGESPQVSLWRRLIGANFVSDDVQVDPFKSLGSQDLDNVSVPLSAFPYMYSEEKQTDDSIKKYEVRTFENRYRDDNPTTPGFIYFSDSKGAFHLDRAGIGNVLKYNSKINKHRTYLKHIADLCKASTTTSNQADLRIENIAKKLNNFILKYYALRQQFELRKINNLNEDFNIFASERIENTSQTSLFFEALISDIANKRGVLYSDSDKLFNQLFAAVFSKLSASLAVNVSTNVRQGIYETEDISDESVVLRRHKTKSFKSVPVEHNKYLMDFLKIAFKSVNDLSSRNNVAERVNSNSLPLNKKSVDLFYIDFWPGKTKDGHTAYETLEEAFLTGVDYGTTQRSMGQDDYVAGIHLGSGSPDITRQNWKFISKLENSPLFQTILSLMESEYKYVKDEIRVNNKTAYSRTDVRAYMYGHFTLIMKMIGRIIPISLDSFDVVRKRYDPGRSVGEDENALNIPLHDAVSAIIKFDKKKLFAEYSYNSSFDGNVYYPKDSKSTTKTTNNRTLTYDLFEKAVVNDILSLLLDSSEPDNVLYCKLINSLKIAYEKCIKEYQSNLKLYYFLNGYVDYLDSKRKLLLDSLKNDLGNIVEKIKYIITTSDSKLPTDLRELIADHALAPEQLIFNSVVSSEILDKINSSDTYAKLKDIPQFSFLKRNINNNIESWAKFLPQRDLELVSFSYLSSFFKSAEFLKQKSHNAKILGVAVPPKLIRRISEGNISNNSLTNSPDCIFNICVYRINHRYPNLVFKPMKYRFHWFTFPTRVLSNWNIDTLLDNKFDLQEIPLKLYKPVSSIESSRIVYCKNINDYTVFKSNSNVKDDELYTNHAKSFLLGEYIRWFTGMNFDEEKYYRYGKDFEQESLSKLEQSNSMINHTVQIVPATANGNFMAYKDAMNNIYYVPVSEQQNNNKNGEIIDVTENVNDYFKYDTMLLPLASVQKRFFYPKKFDRVFNILVDPDDFAIDTSKPGMSPTDRSSALAKYVDEGLVIKISEYLYKMKEMEESDISFDEYFVTLESSDSVNNWSQ